MNKNGIRAGDWVELNTDELQKRGGVSFRHINKLLRLLEYLCTFIDDYKDDMKRGFQKGWRMV